MPFGTHTSLSFSSYTHPALRTLRDRRARRELLRVLL